jgi:hypothetical protein
MYCHCVAYSVALSSSRSDVEETSLVLLIFEAFSSIPHLRVVLSNSQIRQATSIFASLGRSRFSSQLDIVALASSRLASLPIVDSISTIVVFHLRLAAAVPVSHELPTFCWPLILYTELQCSIVGHKRVQLRPSTTPATRLLVQIHRALPWLTLNCERERGWSGCREGRVRLGDADWGATACVKTTGKVK